MTLGSAPSNRSGLAMAQSAPSVAAAAVLRRGSQGPRLLTENVSNALRVRGYLRVTDSVVPVHRIPSSGVFVTRQTEKSTTGRASLCCAQPDPTGLDGEPGSRTEDPAGGPTRRRADATETAGDLLVEIALSTPAAWSMVPCGSGGSEESVR